MVSPDCDLRDFAFMPLDVVRLRDSDIAALSSGDEFRCAVLLWCASWHQLPAASLPDDDQILSQLAGFGRVVKEWKKVRNGALRGWVVCADGRLYHPVVAEKAREAWRAKLVQRWKTECARIKKANQRNGTSAAAPSIEEFLAEHEKAGQPKHAPEDNAGMSLGTNGTCPQGQTKPVPEDSPIVSPDCPPGNGIQGTVDRDSGQVNLKTKTPKPPTPDKPARFDPLSIDLPDCVTPEAWAKWIAYRRARKLTTAEPTVTAQAAKLAEWHEAGHDPTEIIDTSITNGWQGLFEPKDSRGNERYDDKLQRTADALTGRNRRPASGEAGRTLDGEARAVD
jgi:hypothetical protein